jgi:hypothetical protein
MTRNHLFFSKVSDYFEISYGKSVFQQKLFSETKAKMIYGNPSIFLDESTCQAGLMNNKIVVYGVRKKHKVL